METVRQLTNVNLSLRMFVGIPRMFRMISTGRAEVPTRLVTAQVHLLIILTGPRSVTTCTSKHRTRENQAIARGWNRQSTQQQLVASV